MDPNNDLFRGYNGPYGEVSHRVWYPLPTIWVTPTWDHYTETLSTIGTPIMTIMGTGYLPLIRGSWVGTHNDHIRGHIQGSGV